MFYMDQVIRFKMLYVQN